MTKVALLLAYQGTAYSGWQQQPNDPSIQEIIEGALKKISQTRVPLIASGRTDAGVHAYGQVAHFQAPDYPLFKEPYLIKKALNALLPQDIVIRDVAFFDDNFHARYLAVAKEYHYSLTRLSKPLPWQYNFFYNPLYSLSIELMQEGANLLVGTHDFASFANHGRDYSSTVRTIYTLDILEQENSLTIVCKGSGFLYKMVRNLVGALLDIGKRKYPPAYLLDILEQKNRRKGPSAAPPHGLCLQHVCYPYPYNNFCCKHCSITSLND
ncbi:tRNA pseudouridine synthase A,tRNA pseudouridine synthase A,tRNA pseudouridine(38-40) synthase,tRNA pseudouridine synthase [Chlamydia serpentis]|uniref:tRNA pseudouridine synthase A n=1 Tax=Chlamydia serpentis TaxID=1967782 RepID=A0A2R8FB89_9CHLA|nr:tRNA pseudouridine(38-40) synthase TruA [Chlamydia serpentis]SPN73700.1 tRNA pseudouridine synthase A,tRNA pseudouridine synthase A,tRNA pseudouridine(38-40) synthase,tRNA pseudouridine synthase [Chlamydia serpentis]